MRKAQRELLSATAASLILLVAQTTTGRAQQLQLDIDATEGRRSLGMAFVGDLAVGERANVAGALRLCHTRGGDVFLARSQPILTPTYDWQSPWGNWVVHRLPNNAVRIEVAWREAPRPSPHIRMDAGLEFLQELRPCDGAESVVHGWLTVISIAGAGRVSDFINSLR
jgi:hypothetical protein